VSYLNNREVHGNHGSSFSQVGVIFFSANYMKVMDFGIETWYGTIRYSWTSRSTNTIFSFVYITLSLLKNLIFNPIFSFFFNVLITPVKIWWSAWKLNFQIPHVNLPPEKRENLKSDAFFFSKKNRKIKNFMFRTLKRSWDILLLKKRLSTVMTHLQGIRGMRSFFYKCNLWTYRPKPMYPSRRFFPRKKIFWRCVAPSSRSPITLKKRKLNYKSSLVTRYTMSVMSFDQNQTLELQPVTILRNSMHFFSAKISV